MKKTKILILAGGNGTRIKSTRPKVLIPLHGKPMIGHLLKNLSTLDANIGLVIGHLADQVKETLGDLYDYYIQEQQLGTGHAVQITEDSLKKEGIERLVVLYGDHPFISAESIQSLVNLHKETNPPVCIITVKLPDYEDWRKAFFYWGRILRNKGGALKAIRESKDCSMDEIDITEVNPGLYSFDTGWLWKNISRLQNNNAQGEYYLTDLIEIAISQGHAIPTIFSKPEECIGINSPEELRLAKQILKN